MRDYDSTGRLEADVEDVTEADLLTVRDAARVLNVTTSWVYEHTRMGGENRLPAVKIGKYLRFDRRDLRAYIDRRREAAHIDVRR